MKLEKDGVVITLDNPNHITAYKCCGWTEVTEEPKKAPKPKKK